MTTQTTNEKLIENSIKYIWNRIKIIGLTIVLMILVKNHPGWDTFFLIFIIFHSFLIFLNIVILKYKINQKDKSYNNQYNYKQQYQRQSYNRRIPTISSSLELSHSAQLLGIDIKKDNNDTIKKKYRKLAMIYHPDRFSSNDIQKQDIAKRNFQKLNNAYNIVKKHKNFI